MFVRVRARSQSTRTPARLPAHTPRLPALGARDCRHRRPYGSDNSSSQFFNMTFLGAAAASSSSGATWHQVTAAQRTVPDGGASISARRGHAMVEFLGDIWVLGGYSTPADNATAPWRPSSRRLLATSSEYMLADVWRLRFVSGHACGGGAQASDAGVCVQERRVQPQAAWPGRHSHAVAVMGGRMWLMGGVTATELTAHDVWSSYDGVEWGLVTAAAPWSPRFSMALDVVANPGAASDPGILVLAGGGAYVGGSGGGDVVYNDVWTSADGKQWQRATANASWAPRARHGLAALRNSAGKVTLVLAGGERAGQDTASDVWSSSDNGATWQSLTPEGAPWRDRAGHAMLRLQGQLLVAAGRSKTPGNVDLAEPVLRDVWRSADGYTWELVAEAIADAATQTAFAGREDMGAALHAASGRLVVFGGQGMHGRLDDLWLSPLPGS